MAKKPTTAAKAAPASVAPPLPPELLQLLAAASAAAITTARATAEAEAKPGDEAATAAATAAAELLVNASDAIDAWFVGYVADRLAAAQDEADRQLEEKRATLKTLIEELDEDGKRLTARRAYIDAELKALKNSEATVETGGDGDAAIPAILQALPEGLELITVIGPAAGLRRAGHLFNAVPNTVAVTPEQKAMIAADPALSITDDPSAAAELASRLGEKPTASAFLFNPEGYTDVKVLGPKGGRRRIGHSFGPEESIVRVDASELEELLADHLLAVGQA